MESFIWTVKPAAPPKLARRCGRCGHTHFISSGRFRVNANGGRLDVWLIWKCERCMATWNMDILSRVRTDRIDRELFRRFLENDEALALYYALNDETLDQNGASADPDTFILEIGGEIPPDGACAHISLVPDAPLGVRAARVIAQKLGISQSAVRRMIDEGVLECGADIRKKRLSETVSLLLHAGWGRR